MNPTVTLVIEGPDGVRTVALDDELTIGRSNEATVAVADPGLSRVNTTFFRDGDEVLVVDENSTNGTFLNGDKLTGPPRIVRDGDRLSLGTHTQISIRIGSDDKQAAPAAVPAEKKSEVSPVPQPSVTAAARPADPVRGENAPPLMLIAALILTLLIIGGVITALLLAPRDNRVTAGPGGATPRPVAISDSVIPMRVIDPLGGENEESLDDLIASWETEEKELDASTVADVAAGTDADDADLNVPASLLADRMSKSFEPRSGETGIRPAGLRVPKELFGDGVIKQTRKLAEMKGGGYQQPLDFADLAEKRLNKELIEMPMAAPSYYLSVGGSATTDPFTSFDFRNGSQPIGPGSPKFSSIQRLADNFAGTKYDINNPNDRKQMRIRLLRMFNKRAKPILLELANAYYQRFNRPLRVTSLTRSMDYQISLNATNANSFKVRGEGSLPPHTSGCAFDLARRHMTAEEQNFVMDKLAEMENANKLDALIEYGENACFHVFIYSDGNPPRM